MTFRPWMLPALYLLWLVGMAALILKLSGCGQMVATADVDGGPPDLTHELDEPDDDQIPSMGGRLPPGYYQRQCQWDACGGPLPDHTQRLSNPQPEDTK